MSLSAMVVSPAWSVPSPLASTYALISQPDRPRSSGRSRVPFAFTSLNFVPDLVPCWKFPNRLPVSVLPDVMVTAKPPFPTPAAGLIAEHLLLLGADWNHVACSTSQTTYLPGFRVSV